MSTDSEKTDIQHKKSIDRLKLLYPNVDEDKSPIPRQWSSLDKCSYLGLNQNNLRVHYKGNSTAFHLVSLQFVIS
jgi:hypothetical protein